MFARSIRSSSVALGSAACALLLGCAAGFAHDTQQTVTIGQGGYYTIQTPATAQEAPYALTGNRDYPTPSGVAGVHQNYGQSTLVIPPMPQR